MEGKPVGLVYIGILYEGVNIYELNLKGSRTEIQQQAIDFVIKKLIEKVKVN
jgi:nicotinamide mononucleotide (NMN) deamidase PncC